jgi:hypothetical protein
MAMATEVELVLEQLAVRRGVHGVRFVSGHWSLALPQPSYTAAGRWTRRVWRPKWSRCVDVAAVSPLTPQVSGRSVAEFAAYILCLVTEPWSYLSRVTRLRGGGREDHG